MAELILSLLMSLVQMLMTLTILFSGSVLPVLLSLTGLALMGLLLSSLEGAWPVPMMLLLIVVMTGLFVVFFYASSLEPQHPGAWFESPASATSFFWGSLAYVLLILMLKEYFSSLGFKAWTHSLPLEGSGQAVWLSCSVLMALLLVVILMFIVLAYPVKSSLRMKF